MKLTEKAFWEKYWGEIDLPIQVNTGFKNDRVIAKAIDDFVPIGNENKMALEIGCAPGKWMAYIYKELNYNVDGFEYLGVASDKTKENLLLCGIPEGRFEVKTVDFLSQIPEEKYDLTISLGFIEHFDNYQEIFQKHLDFTKKDGYIVIGIPCFRGLTYYVQFLIDKMTGSKIIENHNISMMETEKMKDMVTNTEGNMTFIGYIGGFEPALFNLNDINNSFIRFIFKFIVKSFGWVFNTIEHNLFSSYLLFVVKK